jgi:hypothetical protein
MAIFNSFLYVYQRVFVFDQIVKKIALVNMFKMLMNHENRGSRGRAKDFPSYVKNEPQGRSFARMA